MSYKNQLKELSFIVNDGLTNYIKIHDYIHDESETLISAVKNFFGFGVSMDVLLKKAETLIPVWASISDRINDFKKSAYPNLSDDEKYYFETLISYVNAVQKTIASLVERQKFMEEGTNRFFNWLMSWKAFQEKRKVYQASVEEYCIIGQKLNDAKHIVLIDCSG